MSAQSQETNRTCHFSCRRAPDYSARRATGAGVVIDVRPDQWIGVAVVPAHLPDDITEILLVAQLPADHAPGSVLTALDLDTGRPIGQLQLPKPGPTGLLQLGALHRADIGWALQPQPAPLDHDLAGLATAAGVDVA